MGSQCVGSEKTAMFGLRWAACSLQASHYSGDSVDRMEKGYQDSGSRCNSVPGSSSVVEEVKRREGLQNFHCSSKLSTSFNSFPTHPDDNTFDHNSPWVRMSQDRTQTQDRMSKALPRSNGEKDR